MDSGVHASLHPNCYYEIVYAKLNLKTEYHPLYERLIWEYKITNTQFLNRTTETFNWEKLLELIFMLMLMSSYIFSIQDYAYHFS